MVVGGRLGRGEEWEKIGTTLIEQQQKKEKKVLQKINVFIIYYIVYH